MNVTVNLERGESDILEYCPSFTQGIWDKARIIWVWNAN